VRKYPLNKSLHFAAALTAVVAITFVYRRLVIVNNTTVALSFLLAVLVAATFSGLAVGVFTSLAAVLAFNYFFLPPFGTFTIADPQNWVALFAFLMSALIASHLAAKERKEAEAADRRRRETERLYAFSQRLLEAGNVLELLNTIPRRIVDAFEAGAAALYAASEQEIYRSGPDTAQIGSEQLKAAMAREEPTVDSERGLCFVTVRMGVRPIGSLGLSGALLSRQTLEALGTLIAIAMERARAIESLTKTEAAKENEKLKSALLDSITHDLRTPLTSIKASVTGLLSDGNLSEGHRRELLTIINEESDRLNQLVEEAGEMAQLDAGEVELSLLPRSVKEVVAAALEQCKNILAERRVEVRIPEGLPPVRADLARAKEVLVRLVENANQYSPKSEPIVISAETDGKFVVTSVADRGPGIDDLEQVLIFDKFYRGRERRFDGSGTGMGLPIARALAEAHGGTLAVTSQLGHGSVFHFSLPVSAVARKVE
jgi:two-component system, OmpR family, sensor histidine kinase KdpD